MKLRGEIALRLPGERRVRGPDPFAVFPVAGGASHKASISVALTIQPNRRRAWRARRPCGPGDGHPGVVFGYGPASVGVELGRDVFHLRMGPTAIRVGDQLPFEIPCVEPGEARRERAIPLPFHAVAGKTCVIGSGVRPAERNQLTARFETIDRSRADRRARAKRGRCGGDEERADSGHVPPETGLGQRGFRSRAYGARFGEGGSSPALLRALLSILLLTTGCKPAPEARTDMSLASADRGKAVIERVGCASCHTIAGVGWPEGKTAPALTEGMAARALIAGQLENRPDLLAAFVRNAPALVPGTTMPAMPLSEQEALDVAAYLYEIER